MERGKLASIRIRGSFARIVSKLYKELGTCKSFSQ